MCNSLMFDTQYPHILCSIKQKMEWRVEVVRENNSLRTLYPLEFSFYLYNHWAMIWSPINLISDFTLRRFVKAKLSLG